LAGQLVCILARRLKKDGGQSLSLWLPVKFAVTVCERLRAAGLLAVNSRTLAEECVLQPLCWRQSLSLSLCVCEWCTCAPHLPRCCATAAAQQAAHSTQHNTAQHDTTRQSLSLASSSTGDTREPNGRLRVAKRQPQEPKSLKVATSQPANHPTRQLVSTKRHSLRPAFSGAF